MAVSIMRSTGDELYEADRSPDVNPGGLMHTEDESKLGLHCRTGSRPRAPAT